MLVYSKDGGQSQTLPCDILKFDTMLLQLQPLVRQENSFSCYSEHFCLYELWGEDSHTVKQIKSACSSPNIKGIVLLNESGHIIDPKFWDDDIGIPICIVSSKVCGDLLSLLGLLGTGRQLRSQQSSNEVKMRVSPVNGGEHSFFIIYLSVMIQILK